MLLVKCPLLLLIVCRVYIDQMLHVILPDTPFDISAFTLLGCVLGMSQHLKTFLPFYNINQ